jgi:VIT1/CCC1 family predicted Fe2+/Mn2+ transporter
MKKAREIDDNLKALILNFQKSEITEYFTYNELSKSVQGRNRGALKKIAAKELCHYNIWKKYSGVDVQPDKLKILKRLLLLKLFGLTFTIKLMEKEEKMAQNAYKQISDTFPEIKNILKDENEHEENLIKLINEEMLEYIGSIVLGLNDALVELTGTLAGLTFALQDTQLIGLAGLISGLSASLSMMSSEYLSQKSEEGEKSPYKASVYTGIAYTATVLFLIFPYFIFSNYYAALMLTLANAVLIIFVFTYFMSVIKDLPFKKRFFEMLTISLGIAAISFAIGFVLRSFLKIDV